MARDLEDWAAKAVLRAAEHLDLTPVPRKKGVHGGDIDGLTVRLSPLWESHGDGTHSVAGAEAFISIPGLPSNLRIQREKPRRARKWRRVICQAGPDLYARADAATLEIYLDRDRVGPLCELPLFRLRKSEMHLEILVRGGADITATVTSRVRTAIRAAKALSTNHG